MKKQANFYHTQEEIIKEKIKELQKTVKRNNFCIYPDTICSYIWAVNAGANYFYLKNSISQGQTKNSLLYGACILLDVACSILFYKRAQNDKKELEINRTSLSRLERELKNAT